MPTVIVLELLLCVLVGNDPKDVAKVILEPVTCKNAPTLNAVTNGQMIAIAGKDPLLPRVIHPFPSHPEDGNDKALGMSWRHIDNQVSDLAPADRFQVFSHRVQVPTVDKGGMGFNDVPSPINTVSAAAYNVSM